VRRAIVVRGKLQDGRIVVLDEPVDDVEEDVEVLMRVNEKGAVDDSESPVLVVHREQPLLHPERMKAEVLAKQKRRMGLGATTELLMARRIQDKSFDDEEETTRDELPKVDKG